MSCHFLYPVKCFPAPAGQVCERQVAETTLSLLTGPSGGAWPSNDYSRGRPVLHDDFSILASPGQACGNTKKPSTLNPQPHK